MSPHALPRGHKPPHKKLVVPGGEQSQGKKKKGRSKNLIPKKTRKRLRYSSKKVIKEVAPENFFSNIPFQVLSKFCGEGLVEEKSLVAFRTSYALLDKELHNVRVTYMYGNRTMYLNLAIEDSKKVVQEHTFLSFKVVWSTTGQETCEVNSHLCVGPHPIHPEITKEMLGFHNEVLFFLHEQVAKAISCSCQHDFWKKSKFNYPPNLVGEAE